MLKHILVPVDESELSERAIDYAKKIVDPKGKITLVMVVDPPGATTGLTPGPYPVPAMDYGRLDYDNIPLNMLEHADAYLDKLILDIKRDVIRSEVHSCFGAPAEAIIETAEDLKVDAIVMTTHGRSGISRWIFGSVTQKVLSAAPCPVFVIPPSKKELKKAQATQKTATQ